MMTAIPVLLALVATPEGCHKIQSDMIFAKDVAEVLPAFAQVSRDFSLGYVLASGEPRILRGVDLERIAKNQRVELNGLPDLCFARETFVPGAEQLRDAMLAELKSAEMSVAEAKIEILSSSQQPVPTGELVFPRSGMQLQQGTQREALWRGYVRSGDGRQFPIWAKVRVTANVKRVVATTGVVAGKPIQGNQVRLESLEDSPFDETAAQTLDEVVGTMSKATLRPGAVIRKTQIEPVPDVARGDLIVVQVFAGGAYLKLEGRAESAGVRGATILVRNLSSGRDFPAQVTGKNQATVGMPAADSADATRN
jgi:flagella basal body P-ring formation protein FlgA